MDFAIEIPTSLIKSNTTVFPFFDMISPPFLNLTLCSSHGRYDREGAPLDCSCYTNARFRHVIDMAIKKVCLVCPWPPSDEQVNLGELRAVKCSGRLK